MSWPNDDIWSALADGRKVDVDGDMYVMSVVDCGELFLPGGRLAACDPFAVMEPRGNPFVQIPPGKYPVKVTLADVSGREDGSHLREAYASVILDQKPEATRKPLIPLAEGEEPPDDLEPDEFIGFGVDSGTACFVDDSALESGMPEDDEAWYDDIFDSGKPDSWFEMMDDPEHIREGLANVPLPLAKNGENLILIHSGWGDGVYPVIGGYDAAGALVAVHIDFLVVGQEE